jgi:HD-like signal output (HDOD) protein
MSVIETIVNTKDLATLPAVANRALEMLKNEDIDLYSISKVIETDPSLTVKLLRVANSPLYATRAEIHSVQQAIMLMGFSKLTNIVLSVSIFSKFWLGTKKGAAELMNQFWQYSSATGTIAKYLTSKGKKNLNDMEFISGLLHQIGKLALIQYDLPKYGEVVELVEKEGQSDLEAEHQIYGVNHIQVGEHVAAMWKLPEEVISVIANYQQPQLAPNGNIDLTAVVGFAGLVCRSKDLGFFNGTSFKPLEETEHWKIISESFPALKHYAMDEILTDTDDEIAKSQEFLGAMN